MSGGATPVAVRKRGKLPAIALAVVVVLLSRGVFGLLVWYKVVWKKIGPVQMLGTDRELSVFVEVRWLVRFPNPLASPRVMEVHSEQYWIHYDGKCWHTPLKVSSPASPTVHPNITRIVRHGDSFYACIGPRRDECGRAYRWVGDRFVRLDERGAAELFQNIGLDIRQERFVTFEDKIDRYTEKSGWTVLYREGRPLAHEDPVLSPWKFQWRGMWYFVVAKEHAGIVTYSMVGPSDYDEEVELVTVDTRERRISNREYRELRGQPRWWQQ